MVCHLGSVVGAHMLVLHQNIGGRWGQRQTIIRTTQAEVLKALSPSFRVRHSAFLELRGADYTGGEAMFAQKAAAFMGVTTMAG